ncbi:type IV pilin-like G/H family protein [Microcoleus sp. AT9_B5]
MSQQDSKSASILPNGCGCLLLLMGIVVMGAIALPSFLRQAGKAKGSEPQHYVNAMNRSQHAHFAEKGAFATSVNALEIGIKTETATYKYSVSVTEKSAFSYGVSKEKDLKSYVGGVFLVPDQTLDTKAVKNQIRPTYILCVNDFFGTIKPAEPTYQNGKIACGKGTTQVTR